MKIRKRPAEDDVKGVPTVSDVETIDVYKNLIMHM